MIFPVLASLLEQWINHLSQVIRIVAESVMLPEMVQVPGISTLVPPMRLAAHDVVVARVSQPRCVKAPEASLSSGAARVSFRQAGIWLRIRSRSGR